MCFESLEQKLQQWSNPGEMPADIFVQFLALDQDKQMIQAMRSGTVVRPGESQGCIG